MIIAIQLTDKFVFVTSNSFNPQLSYNEKVSRNKFKYIKQFFPHRKNYVINPNGYIFNWELIPEMKKINKNLG